MQNSQVIIIVGLMLIFAGCPAKVDPHFANHCFTPTWRRAIEERIDQGFQQYGLNQTNNSPEIVAYGIIGTWDNEIDYYWVEKRGLYRINPNVPIINYENSTYGKIQFYPDYRRAAWYFAWNGRQPEQISKHLDEITKFYLEKIHKN